MDQQTTHHVTTATPPPGDPSGAETYHVCLAGPSVSNNWALIDALKQPYQVTVIASPGSLLQNSVLSTVDVLLLDLDDQGAEGIGMLRDLRAKHPNLCTVLVNGGLAQSEIAAAFREGVRDYFSHHFNVALLTERVHYLCSQARKPRS